nr:serine/arginine-rich splicing factor SR45-like [Coffea arabica]
MARTRSKRTVESTGPGAGEGSRRAETEAVGGVGGSALSGERRQQILQFVTENLPMLEDIIRQAKEGGEAGGAHTSKVKGKEKEPLPDPSEDGSRDQPPRRKRPRTPPRPRASVVGDSERHSRDRPAGSRPRDPSPRKPAWNEPERSPTRSVKSRPRDPSVEACPKRNRADPAATAVRGRLHDIALYPGDRRLPTTPEVQDPKHRVVRCLDRPGRSPFGLPDAHAPANCGGRDPLQDLPHVPEGEGPALVPRSGTGVHPEFSRAGQSLSSNSSLPRPIRRPRLT